MNRWGACYGKGYNKIERRIKNCCSEIGGVCSPIRDIEYQFAGPARAIKGIRATGRFKNRDLKIINPTVGESGQLLVQAATGIKKNIL